LGSSG